jgi:copper(I)-binding protein
VLVRRRGPAVRTPTASRGRWGTCGCCTSTSPQRDSAAAPHDPGDGADLLLTVANDGTAADVLSGASSDAAEQVVFGDGDLTATSPLRVAAPAGGVASLQDVSGPHLELSGLTQELRSGGSVPVTFTFATAGSVTLQVPVATYDPAAATSTSAAPP